MTKCEICEQPALFKRDNEYYCIDCNENYGIDPSELKQCDRCNRLRKLRSWTVNGSHFMWCSSCAGSVFPD